MNKAIIKALILILKCIDRNTYQDYKTYCETKADFHNETMETIKMLEKANEKIFN